MAGECEGLTLALTERVLETLGFSDRPEPALDGLKSVYDAWCRHVPFDNVRKLIRLRDARPGPLPGDDPADFFQAWLRYGTGGTCWAGNGALQALLAALGFEATHGIATMLASPRAPPNHGTVVVLLDGRRYLVDASILHGEPLPLEESGPAAAGQPAWRAQADARGGQWFIHWRPLHNPAGIDCRIERLDGTAATFRNMHEKTRHWGPFNYQLYARRNRGPGVIGTAFGQRVEIDAGGGIHPRPLEPQDRIRFMVEEIGINEELASRLPADLPTPPPPP